MPVVTNLRNPNLKTRHWEALESVIGQKLPPGILLRFFHNDIFKYPFCMCLEQELIDNFDR